MMQDRSVIGNAMPKMELGFGNYFTFGRWDLSVFFKGVFGHEMVNEYFAGYGAPRNYSKL
jgi:TonB-dependent starch-binding outer membrane protein SusC